MNHVDDYDDPDVLVVLPFGSHVPGAQHDDGVTAVALIDLARYVLARQQDIQRALNDERYAALFPENAP